MIVFANICSNNSQFWKVIAGNWVSRNQDATFIQIYSQSTHVEKAKCWLCEKWRLSGEREKNQHPKNSFVVFILFVLPSTLLHSIHRISSAFFLFVVVVLAYSHLISHNRAQKHGVTRNCQNICHYSCNLHDEMPYAITISNEAKRLREHKNLPRFIQKCPSSPRLHSHRERLSLLLFCR